MLTISGYPLDSRNFVTGAMTGMTLVEKAPCEGGYVEVKTAMDTAVETGMFNFAATKAELRFCMAPGMYCVKSPSTSLPAMA